MALAQPDPVAGAFPCWWQSRQRSVIQLRERVDPVSKADKPQCNRTP